MNFCSQCGSSVTLRVPHGDHLPRHVCDSCGAVHYQNPKIVAGCIPEWGEQVLLCRRAIEPRRGHWTLPAGFMENGETTAQAAARETLEEACARIDVGEAFSMVSIPHISQVHLFFRARLIDPKHAPGEESLEVSLFEEDDIPWDTLAFRSVTLALRHYFDDRRRDRFCFHADDLDVEPSMNN